MQNQVATVKPNNGMAITSFIMGLIAILWYIIIYLLACILSGQTAVSALSIMLIAGPYSHDLKMRICKGNGHLSNDECAAAVRKFCPLALEK